MCRVCMLCLHTLFRIIYSVDGVHSQEATPEILWSFPKNAWGYPGIECKFCLPTSHTRGEVFCTLYFTLPRVRGILPNIFKNWLIELILSEASTQRLYFLSLYLNDKLNLSWIFHVVKSFFEKIQNLFWLPIWKIFIKLSTAWIPPASLGLFCRCILTTNIS